jgi:hypothetical protein
MESEQSIPEYVTTTGYNQGLDIPTEQPEPSEAPEPKTDYTLPGMDNLYINFFIKRICFAIRIAPKDAKFFNVAKYFFKVDPFHASHKKEIEFITEYCYKYMVRYRIDLMPDKVRYATNANRS